MKKIVILLTIATMLAAPAFAGIRNSKHDLSSSGGTSYASTNTDELCVFCHTPHGGTVGGFAPLWNRSGADFTLELVDLYNSSTLESNSNPSQVAAAVNLSDAKLCLTCHDGGSLAGGLLNPPASNGNIPPEFTKTAITGNANLYDGTDTNTTNDTSMLTNDHPIGMTYLSSAIGGATGDQELNFNGNTEYADRADGSLPLYSGTVGAVTYSSVMWCSTCHDVHNPDKGTPFLNTSNAGSAMCLTCHDK